jgi:hypothetical protein
MMIWIGARSFFNSCSDICASNAYRCSAVVLRDAASQALPSVIKKRNSVQTEFDAAPLIPGDAGAAALRAACSQSIVQRALHANSRAPDVCSEVPGRSVAGVAHRDQKTQLGSDRVQRLRSSRLTA